MNTISLRVIKISIFLCGFTAACLIAQQSDDAATKQLHANLATAQSALTVYRRSAPEQEFPILLEFLRYYRSWYQAVTPAPIALIERLSPAALKFVAQLKFIAKQYQQAPRNMPGASKLTEMGDQFYQAVLEMVQSQLIDKQLAKIMVIPHLQTRLL